MSRHGMPLLDSLDLLSRQAQGSALHDLIQGAALDVREGIPLSASLAMRFPSLPSYYAEMLLAAEESGAFDEILQKLESHLAREISLRRELISASLYPCFVSLISLITGLLVLSLVVPAFRDLFTEMGAPLPWITRLALALSDAAICSLVPTLFAVPLVVLLAKTSSGKRCILRALRSVPVYGAFLRRCALARLTGTLSALVGSGMPLARALKLASQSTGDEAQRAELLSFSDRIFEGEPLSRLLAASSHFPPELAAVAQLGESSGALDEVLLASSKLYESEARESASLLKASVEPLLVATIGVFVGGLMLAVYLPIFGLGGLAQ